MNQFNETENYFIQSKRIFKWSRIGITDKVREWLKSSKEGLQTAIENEKYIDVYTFQYYSQGHLVQGFLAQSKGDIKKNPCIVYNRGGTADFGKLKIGNFFTGIIPSLAREGYLVFASQYSGAGLSEGRDEMGGNDVEDVLNLHEIIREYPLADSSRIGMYGASRGGMMTYLCLKKARGWIRTAVVVSGIADLPNNEKFRSEFRDHFTSIFGKGIQEREDRSVLYWVEKLPKDVPLLLMNGTSDWRVDPRDSLHLAEKFLEYKIPYRLVMFEGNDHHLMENRKEADEQIIQWFNRFLKSNEKLPNMELHGK